MELGNIKKQFFLNEEEEKKQEDEEKEEEEEGDGVNSLYDDIIHELEKIDTHYQGNNEDPIHNNQDSEDELKIIKELDNRKINIYFLLNNSIVK